MTNEENIGKITAITFDDSNKELLVTIRILDPKLQRSILNTWQLKGIIKFRGYDVMRVASKDTGETNEKT